MGGKPLQQNSHDWAQQWEINSYNKTCMIVPKAQQWKVNPYNKIHMIVPKAQLWMKKGNNIKPCTSKIALSVVIET